MLALIRNAVMLPWESCLAFLSLLTGKVVVSTHRMSRFVRSGLRLYTSVSLLVQIICNYLQFNVSTLQIEVVR